MPFHPMIPECVTELQPWSSAASAKGHIRQQMDELGKRCGNFRYDENMSEGFLLIDLTDRC